jgi:hypothetical protein
LRLGDFRQAKAMADEALWRYDLYHMAEKISVVVDLLESQI